VPFVDDPSDPLLADFTALNDPATRRVVERTGGYFVVEGIVAIERLLGLPPWEVRSLALLPRVAERLAPSLAGRGLPVAVATEDVLREVVGFDIHRGALASVVRRPPVPVGDVVAPGSAPLLLALEGLNDHENLGAAYRNAAAFGCAGVILDPTCADPFYRRSVRVSQGNVLAVSTAAMTDLGDLRRAGIATVALTPRSERQLVDLDRSELGEGPLAVVVGAEGAGLRAETIEAADHRAGIAMADGVDSLNVATAAAIALFHLQAARAGRATGSSSGRPG
jgi:tRNA G18 (ribose-2'-O)-methylase SpoU